MYRVDFKIGWLPRPRQGASLRFDRDAPVADTELNPGSVPRLVQLIAQHGGDNDKGAHDDGDDVSIACGRLAHCKTNPMLMVE